MKNYDSDNATGDNGLDAAPGGADSAITKLGGHDKKKMFLLAGLLVIGGAVAAYQFLGSGGPTPATAVMVPSPGPGTASAATPTAADPAGGAATHKDEAPAGEDELSVPRVEKLVKEFDGYVKARQVPLQQLKTSPFRTKPSRAIPKTEVAGGPGAAAASLVDEPKVRPREAMPKLTLGSIMVAGDKRWAVINSRLCSVGSTISGCRVEAIEADHVRLSRDGETLDLLLKPHAAETDSRDSNAN